MSHFIKLSLIAGIFAFFSMTSVARAGVLEVGGALGLSAPFSDSLSSRLLYNAHASFGITSTYRLGFSYSGGPERSSTLGGLDSTTKYDLYSLELSSGFSGMWLGVGAGWAKLRRTYASGALTIDGTSLLVGLRGGYDYALNPLVSVGGEMQLNYLTSTDANPSCMMLNFLANVKFWFL